METDCQESAACDKLKVTVELPTYTLKQRETIIKKLLLTNIPQVTCNIQDDSSSCYNGCDEICDFVFKSVKLRWANLMRGVLADLKLPVSAIWKCSTGSNESFSFGSNKYQVDKAKSYYACDITSINYERLTATADVYYPGEDDATEVIDIYLHELSLVKMNSDEEHEDGAADMMLTDEEIKSANVMLDHLRFFCTVIWFPWDEKQEEEIDDSFGTHDPKEDWVEVHLEHRVNAYNDYLEGSNDVYDRLIKLAGEHDQLMNRQNDITSFYENDDLVKDDLIIGENLEIEDALDNIKKKADRLENPNLRNAVERMARLRKAETRKTMMSDYARIGYPNNDQVICLVIGKLTNLKGMGEFMQKAQQKVGFDIRLANVIYRETLQLAVDDLLPGDIIVLPPGDHVLKDWGDLKEGGSLYGIDANDPSVVELSTMPRRYGLEVRNGATFENIVFSSSHLTNNNNMSNDMSFDDGESFDLSSQLSKRHGLLVRSGSVQMINCTFLGLECAAKIMENGSLVMKKCKLHLNKVGLIAARNTNITLNDVSFEGDTESDAEKYGMIILENMSGNNIAFNNVNLRYDNGHFVFVDPGFFAKKKKTESFLYYENSWEDVSPLLSKSLKNNLILEQPVSYHLDQTVAKKSLPLKVVAMLSMDNYDYAKRRINIKPQIPNQPDEAPSEDGAGDCGMITHDVKENDLFITSSGTMITSTMV